MRCPPGPHQQDVDVAGEGVAQVVQADRHLADSPNEAADHERGDDQAYGVREQHHHGAYE